MIRDLAGGAPFGMRACRNPRLYQVVAKGASIAIKNAVRRLDLE
jgi:hypothetical protein